MSRALIALVLALLLVPATANAHELTVLAPGAAELDLGNVSSPRLVHATLVDADDELRLSLRLGDAPIAVQLFVPEVLPERDARGDDLPGIQGEEAPSVEDTPTDEATGIRYRLVESTFLDPTQYQRPDVNLTIERGGEPTRVAVLVGDPDATFASTDLERTPQTLARLRAWAETPAEGSKPVRAAAASRDSRSRSPWYGAVIALVAVLTAAWWIRSGSRRAQERGIERSADEN